MHKCSNCGQEFDGNFCPNCGANINENKICPNCGAALASNAKFCNQCGYSFTDTAPASGAVAATKAPNKVLSWIKSHLKILIPVAALLLVAIVMLSLIPTFIKASVNGTYYLYDSVSDEVYTNYSYTLNTGNWKASDGSEGTYEVNDKKVTFYGKLFGETLVIGTATVDNGVLCFEVLEVKTVYVTKDHKHKYGSWKDKDELTCTQDQTQSRTCGCGKADVKVVAEAKGHQGKWTVTKEATCTDIGKRETHCTVCDQDITEDIEMRDHDLEWNASATVHFQTCTMCKQSFDEGNHDKVDGCTTCGYPFKYKFDSHSNSYSVIGIYSSVDKNELIIPLSFNQLSVKRIDSTAFRNCTNLTSITIPDSVTFIGSEAFRNCTSLTSITIPDSVNYIGGMAFYSCTSLTSVTIPDSVYYIGDDAFNNTAYFNNVNNWTDKVLYINNHLVAAENISGHYTIKAGTKTIASYAFAYCDSLTSVTIPDSVTSIDSFAFRGCTSLTSVTIPDSVTYIGAYAFAYCDSLTSVTFQKTSGWSLDAGRIISSSDLKDSSTAATYLKSTYLFYTWRRS